MYGTSGLATPDPVIPDKPRSGADPGPSPALFAVRSPLTMMTSGLSE